MTEPQNHHSHAEAAHLVARFWSAWVPEEKRPAFVSALLPHLTEGSYQKCDYDPDPTLLKALSACGMECRGYMFSADTIGFPRKTVTHIGESARVRWGYRSEWEPITDALITEADLAAGK